MTFIPDEDSPVRVGDRIRVVPSGRQSTVARIVTMDDDLDEAVAEQSVTITPPKPSSPRSRDTIADENKAGVEPEPSPGVYTAVIITASAPAAMPA